MNEQEFTRSVIRGADALLEMMNQNPAAYMKIARVSRPPLSISNTPGIYRLHLDDYVRDGAEVYDGEQRIPGVEIRKLCMKKGEKYADVFVPEQAITAFESADWKRMTLRTDMRFLIERMRDFYSKHTLLFNPPSPDPIPDGAFSLEHPLSEQQRQAVDAALSNPVTYVWGAPGTGKTQAVLATCLLRYIAAKRRVLLLAPTNNAVEQSLLTILPILQKNGIPLTDVYRLGAASVEFSTRFPEVVGDRSLEQRSEELAEQTAKLTAELEHARTHEADVAAATKRIVALVPARAFLDVQLPLLSDAITAASEAQRNHSVSNERLAQCKNSFDRANDAVSQRETLIRQYHNSIAENQKRGSKLRLLPWKRSEYNRLQQQNKQLDEQVHAVRLTLTPFVEERDAAKAELELAQKAERTACSELERKQKEAAAIRNGILSRCAKIGMQCSEDALPEDLLSAFLDFCSQMKQSCEALIQENLRESAVIERELSEIRSERKAIGSTSKLEQFQNALVVAATFDTAVGHLPKLENADPYSHVFIDEAGYASLARGMTAFSCGSPVSFFGDHFQLPPICEMNTKEIKEEHPEVALWAVPVVAYSDLVQQRLPRLISLLDRPEYTFDMLKYVRLLRTYRFGTKLARILDAHVYHTSGRFEGVARTSFEVLVLHGAKQPTDRKRESVAEAMEIRDYLQKAKPDEGSYIILAPYHMQIERLKKLMPSERSNILTVHRAQGMEWDTVILSVCDTKDAYFVNSGLTVGKCVLNTAISRAKKRLVIVCDTNFWDSERKQLISELIAQSTGKQSC